MVYIAVMVPEWMRDISVLSNAEALFRFLIVENLVGSMAVFAAHLALRKRHARSSATTTAIKVPEIRWMIGLLISINIGLRFLLT